MLFIFAAVLLTMMVTAIPVSMTKDCIKRKAYISLTLMYIVAFALSVVFVISAIDLCC